MKTTDKIILYLTFLMVITGIFLKFINIDTASFEINNVFSVLGLIITTISFLVACYFLVAAISIYSKTKEFDLLKSQIQDGIKSFKNEHSSLAILTSESEKRLTTSLKEIASVMDNFISDQIRLIDERDLPSRIGQELKGYFESRKKSLYRERAIVALKYSLVDDNRRLNLIREFSQYANRMDLKLLFRVANNEKEALEVREMAQFIIEEVKKKDL